MTGYRRARFCGWYYFFTLVTYKRREFLVTPLARKCLRKAWQSVRSGYPFEITAVCLLPDHLHCIWKLPPEDNDFPRRWQQIKKAFTRDYIRKGGAESSQTASRHKKRERGIWQRRFWEHQIRDENDLQKHIDYIHYNPVKHGLVEDAADWPWSTYHRFVRSGIYGNKRIRNFRDDLPDGLAGE